MLSRDSFVGINDFGIISCQFNGNNVHYVLYVLYDAGNKNDILEHFDYKDS